MDLRDQTTLTILITGCSSGIGRALAAELGGRGHRVFATARRPEAVAPLDRESGGHIEALALDVTDPASIEAAVHDVVERAGGVDVLINNAGINQVGPLAELDPEALREILETNVIGVAMMVQAVFPHMAAARRGRIVNIGSIVSYAPTPFAAPYCASKAAVRVLTDVLRMEAAPFGIDVIEIQPGAIRSNIGARAARDIERYERDDSLYHPFASFIRARATASQARPTPTDVFARRAADAILRKRAPRRVRIGRLSTASSLGHALLPERTFHRLLARRFGLGRKL